MSSTRGFSTLLMFIDTNEFVSPRLLARTRMSPTANTTAGRTLPSFDGGIVFRCRGFAGSVASMMISPALVPATNTYGACQNVHQLPV